MVKLDVMPVFICTLPFDIAVFITVPLELFVNKSSAVLFETNNPDEDISLHLTMSNEQSGAFIFVPADRVISPVLLSTILLVALLFNNKLPVPSADKAISAFKLPSIVVVLYNLDVVKLVNEPSLIILLEP